jgi:hypothetical protein
MAVFNTAKHFYEITLILPLALLLIYLQTGNVVHLVTPRGVKVFAIFFSCVVIVSQIKLVTDFFRPMVLKGFAGKGIPIRTFSHQGTKQEISVLRKTCNFPVDEKIKHLIVDDVTYSYFRKTYQPILITWLHVGNEHIDKFKFLDAIGSAGVITRCGYMPPNFRTLSRSVRAGDDALCCISANMF